MLAYVRIIILLFKENKTMNPKVLRITQKNEKKDLPEINVGDTVKVTVKIKEGGKERNQNYEGVIIKVKGSGINKTFTVRRVFQGVGVERVFALHAPSVDKVKVLRSGKVRRSKLYYLRERTGKATKLKEDRSQIKKEIDSSDSQNENTKTEDQENLVQVST